MIDNIIKDILKIYYNIIINKSLCGNRGYYPKHDILQEELYKLANKYNLSCQKEYVGIKFYDKEKNKIFQGRIDLAYYLNNNPYIALEIDCGLKGTSIKKLIANKNFKYRIWFCYNRKIKTNKYYKLINTYDKNKELIYITPTK